MPSPTATTAAVVLAAGASTRLGEPKQRIRIQGESLLRRTVRLGLEAGCAPVFVVLGFDAALMGAELDGLHSIALINEQWPEGMGSSLRRGMEEVCAIEPLPHSVMLLVCDQPKLHLDHLRKLLEMHSQDPTGIVGSAYAGRIGVPAVFGQEFFAAMRSVEGDRGAREVILRHTDRLRSVPWPEGALDIDHPKDREKLAERPL